VTKDYVGFLILSWEINSCQIPRPVCKVFAQALSLKVTF